MVKTTSLYAFDPFLVDDPLNAANCSIRGLPICSIYSPLHALLISLAMSIYLVFVICILEGSAIVFHTMIRCQDLHMHHSPIVSHARCCPLCDVAGTNTAMSLQTIPQLIRIITAHRTNNGRYQSARENFYDSNKSWKVSRYHWETTFDEKRRKWTSWDSISFVDLNSSGTLSELPVAVLKGMSVMLHDVP